ncbi:serine-rich adhesin for platelets-like [Heptranchias perlo]|uniref:serine-rich adhesin for platelets-like n=1 Tax=Heptranchias perlo TaxID=212740 RepID=UPI00355952CD
MQRDVPNNCVHQALSNQSGLMASYPLSQQTLRRPECAYNGLPSSNHQARKITCGSTYSANESAPIYPHQDANQLAYPSSEISSPCGDTTFYPSYLLSTLTRGSQSKTRFQPNYSRSLTTGSQATCFQNRSMRSEPSSFRTPCEFVPSQNRSTWWNRKAHPTIRNFSPYQSPTSAGFKPGAQSSLAALVSSPLLNHKMCPTSEQPPSWSDSKTAFAAKPVEPCWYNLARTNYHQAPVHGPFSHTVDQQSSNVGYHNLNPIQSVNTQSYKESIDHNMFETVQQGEGMQVLQRDSISAPQVSTGNHFMKLRHEEALENIRGTMASEYAFRSQIPSSDYSLPASVLPTDAQRDSSMAFQNHHIDCDSTYREQSISNLYSQKKNSQSSRKRKSPDVLRFLAELTSRELKSLIFAFEIMEKKKRTAEQVNLQSHEVNVPQQNTAMQQSCQFTAQNASCKDANVIPQRSVDLVNGHVEILSSCPPSVLQRLQKDKGAEWKEDNIQISHVNQMSLNTNPTTYSSFNDLSDAASMRDHCAQSRNMNSNPVFQRQGTQPALPPHVVNHQHCYSVKEQTGPSLQAHEENSVCQDDVATSYSHAHCGALGTECNIQNYSFNCSTSSTKSLKPSVSVNPNYLGSSQQNGRYNSMQSLDARDASDINQTDTSVLKTNASQHDEQSLKEIKVLNDMLQTSYVNKINGHSKRQKMEASSTTFQPSSAELGRMNTTSISAVQSPYGNHASQMIDCQDTWCLSAGCPPFVSNSQNNTVMQQVAEFVHREYSPHVERNGSSPSTPSHSRAQERQNAEIAPSFEIFGNVKDAVRLKQSEDKTEVSLIRCLLTGSDDQVNCAVFPSVTRSHTTKPAGIQKSSGCSSEGSGNLQPPAKMDITSSPERAPGQQITEGYLINEYSATTGGFRKKNLTLTLRSEEMSRAQKAAANVGVHWPSAESNDQKSDVSVLTSESFPEHIVSPVPPSKLSCGQSNSVASSVHNQCHTGLHCKTSSGVSAGINMENKSPTSDVYATNDSERNNSSPERVVEELNSVPNSEVLLAKESDTLEFILRSLGIIPEDNGEQSAAILTSLSPGVTNTEQSAVVSLPVDPSCTELKQGQDITLPSFNTVTSSEKQKVEALLGPFSTGCKATTYCSDVASFGTGESQQTRKVHTAAPPSYDDKTPVTSAVGKLKPNGVNQSSSLRQPSIQVKNGENPTVTMALSSAEDNLPSQATGPPNVVTYGASVPVGVGGCQKVVENLLDNSPCAKIKRQQHTVAINTTQLEDGKLHDESNPAAATSCKENGSSTSLINPSKSSALVSVSDTALTLLVEPPLIEQVQEEQETLSLSSADSGSQRNNLVSSPSSSSCVHLATRLINTAANQFSVGSGGNVNRYSLRNGSSPSEVPVCSVINTSNLSVVRHVADGLSDTRKGISKQLTAVPQQETKNGTFEAMGMPIPVAQDSQGNLMLSSEGNFEKSMNCTQAVVPSSTVGIENSSASDASSSIDGTTSNSLHVVQDVLPSRVIRVKCTRSALGIHSFPHSSNGELNPSGLTARQAQLAEGPLIQKETLNGCTAVAVSKNADTDLPLGIRITFVFSLSEYWEHWKVINSKNLISNSLATTSQEVQRSFGKVSSFSTNQMEQQPNKIIGKGPLSAVMQAALNLEESTRRDLVAELPDSWSIDPFANESSAELVDTNILSTATNHRESVFCPELDLNENPVDAKHASEINGLVSTDISKLLPGNVCYNECPTEANDATRVQRETGVLCCLHSKEVINQNFLSKNEFHSATELEMTTESILRFWTPSEEGTESHRPNQETGKGLDFENDLEWIHGGLELYSVTSAAELNKSMHKLSAIHRLHFGFTATVDGRQLHREESHRKGLYNGAEAIVCNEPDLVDDNAPRSHLLTDEDSMSNWTDAALSNVLLKPCKGRACLQNSSNQMTNELETQVDRGKQVEAGKTGITVRGNNPINRHDGHELLNQDEQYPEGSTQPFSGQEILSEYESNMDVSSEIKIKVLECQELDDVLSELSDIIPKTFMLSPEPGVADETTEEESPGTHWETSRNCDNSHLGVGHEQMETSSTEGSSDTSNFAPLSPGRVGNSLQH